MLAAYAQGQPAYASILAHGIMLTCTVLKCVCHILWCNLLCWPRDMNAIRVVSASCGKLCASAVLFISNCNAICFVASEPQDLKFGTLCTALTCGLDTLFCCETRAVFANCSFIHPLQNYLKLVNDWDPPELFVTKEITTQKVGTGFGNPQA